MTIAEINYYEASRAEKSAIRQRIADAAYKWYMPRKSDKQIAINLGYGVPMGIINSMKANHRDDILLQGESCIIGMGEFLEEGDPRINMHRVDPAGNPVLPQTGGATIHSLADAFSFIRSGRIAATFLGAFQVSADGDIANWDTGIPGRMSGPGGAMDLCKGVDRVIVCMIENERDGTSKLVRECTIPLTGRGSVTAIVTDKGVYEPRGDHFERVFKYDDVIGLYVGDNSDFYV